MSGLHYKKDGSLDMRYSSSRQAAASASSSPSYGVGASHGSSYGSSRPTVVPASNVSGSSSSDGLHYKKDGSLDMRYSSSKQAASGQGHSAYSPAATPTSQRASSGADGLHFKKDGSLDMRYSSSKQAAGSQPASGRGQSGYSPAAATATPQRGSSGADGLHYKKDGSLDMRYSSSKRALGGSDSGGGSIASRLAGLNVSPPSSLGVPSSVQTKKDGTPDMRYNEAKRWVAQQAAIHGKDLPAWVPRLKDGTINEFHPLGKAYKSAMPADCSVQYDGCDDQQRRIEYWTRQMQENNSFRSRFETQMEVDVPEPIPYTSYQSYDEDSPSDLPQISVSELQVLETIGKGGFGVVEKASWRGSLVAVKRLHLDRLTRADKKNFLKELDIARQLHLFQHPNLVATLAYCIEPPLLVMELLKVGSLAYVLHYCEDAAVEAKICDGRVKRRLAFGIADGMRQLHTANICHRDLKPQNVLITDEWAAKIGDFGLAELRDQTSCSVGSGRLDQDDELSVHNPAGTAAYMAPELLDSVKAFQFSSDVYSFGILLNELISEEQPYSGKLQLIGGRGPYAAANFAKLGNRPTLARGICQPVSDLINRCWDRDPDRRPTFRDIVPCIENRSFVIPNGGGPSIAS